MSNVTTFPKTPLNGKVSNLPGNKLQALVAAPRGTPNTVNGKVPPLRVRNSDLRAREHLAQKEIDQLMEAARKAGRHGLRDSTLILLGFRHGLRVSELVSLRWDQVDLGQGTLHVNRSKNGSASTHPLRGVEIRALRKLRREYGGIYVFSTERKGPLTTSTVRKLITRAGQKAELDFPVHPHMLRHSTGYYLANKGMDTRSIQAYLGHKQIQHTVRYTELSANRFKDFWSD